MATENKAPEYVSMNEADLDDLDKSLVYNDGVYQMVLSAARRVVRKDGDMMLVVPMRATNQEGSPKGPVIEKWIHILSPNPSVAGHKPDLSRKDDDLADGREFIRAVAGDDALPHYPKYDKESGGYIDPDTKAKMSEVEKRERVKEINRKTLTQLLAWFGKRKTESGAEVEGGAELEGVGLYAGIKRDKNGKAKAYINYVRNTPPTKGEVKYSDFASLV